MENTTLLYIVLAAIVSLTVAVFHYYYKVKSKPKINYLLSGLRFIAVFSLLLLLINPKIEQTILSIEKPVLAVAVDNSTSIKYADDNETVLGIIEALNSNSDLNDKFEVNYFSFDANFTVLDSLTFDGTQSNLSKPFQELKSVYKNRTAPVVLLSDGIQTIGSDYEYNSFNQPVYPIVLGDTTRYSDLSISQLNVNKYAYLDNQFPIEVFLNYEGKTNVNSRFSIYKGNSRVYSKQVSFSADDTSEFLSFHLPATKVGLHQYSAKFEPIDGEKNTINNEKQFVLEVIDEQSSILLVASFWHPDIGALKKSIESNKQRKVTVKLIGEDFELTEYQSVILYQPTSSFSNLFHELNLHELNYLLITGTKTDWQFLNRIQSDYTKSAINQSENFKAVYNPSFGSFVTDNIGFEDFPPLQDVFGEINFNVNYESQLYQQISGFNTQQPLLAAFEDDDLRRVVLFGENTWKWRMQSKQSNTTYEVYDGFIGTIIQYISSAKKGNRLNINYESLVYSNDEFKLTAQYLDKNYKVDTSASLWVDIKNTTTGDSQRFPLSVSNQHYAFRNSGLEAGTYSFTVSVENQSVNAAGEFNILEFDIEQQITRADYEKLERLASKTNGELYTNESFDKLIDQLVQDNKFVAIQKSEKQLNSLIDWQWLLGLIVLSLSIEWILRKYNGLI